jgi:uncharacterized protein YwgA
MDYKEKVLRNITDIQSMIILLANADDVPIKGRTWLQKELFLLSERIEKLREDASYEADLMGPYSDTVEEELLNLEKIGAISIDSNKISLTKNGKDVARALEQKESKQIMEYIHDYKKFLNDLSEDELLCFVYSAHPEMTEESVKYKKLKPKMENILLNLVSKEKISLNRAAELLEKDSEYVFKKLKERG